MPKQIEPNPSIADIAHSVIFSTPLLPASYAAVVSSMKSAVFLLIVDIIFYFGNLLSSGKYADWPTIRTVLLTQVGFMLLKVAASVTAIPGNPLTPLIDAAQTAGVTDVATLVTAPTTLSTLLQAAPPLVDIPTTDIHIADVPPVTDVPPYASGGYVPIVNNPPPGRSGG